MRKPLAIALAVIVVAVLGLPLLTGILTQSSVEERLAAMSANPFAVAELTAYDRGWFGSTAKVELGLSPQYLAQVQPAGADFLAQRLPVLVEFRHGPIILGDGLTLGMSAVTARVDPESPLATTLREQLGVPYVFELRGHAGFGSGFEFDADIPPVDYSDGTSELEFSGLRMDGTLRGNHLVAQGGIESLDYSHPFATVLVEQFRFTADQEHRPSSFAVGSGEVTLERISFASPMLGTEPVFAAQGLRFGGKTEIDEGAQLMRVGLNYGADSVVAGTEFALTDADLGITLADLDATAIGDYYATLQVVVGQQPPASPDEVLAALVPVFERLLAGGPSLALDPVRFAMNGEPVTANLLIEIDPAALPPGPRNFQDPWLWLAAASVSADADVSKTLAHQWAQQFVRMQLASSGDESLAEEDLDAMAEAQAGFLLVTLTGRGLLQDAGNSYTATARFVSGELTVNGAPVPFGLP
jgi:uncharacterized protein YdgA (DUF945 family)